MLKNEYLLKQDIWEKLLRLGTPKEYGTEEIIFFQDQPSPGLVCLKQGKLKTCMFFPNGKEKIFTFLAAPCVLGETPIIDGGLNSCSAIAMCPTEIVFVCREKALEIITGNPDLYHLILKIMAKKMRWMHIQADDLLFSLTERMAYLLLNYDNYGIFPNKEMDGKLDITHDDLANLLGTTRPLVTKHLNEFTKLGLIEKGKGYIHIKDYDGLHRLTSRIL